MVADLLLGKVGKLLSLNTYAYTHNHPTIYGDKDGYYEYLILYDSRPNATRKDEIGGFPNQAEAYEDSLESRGNNVDMKGFQSIQELSEVWNSVNKPYDDMLIFCHGAAGSLDCNGEYISENSASNPKFIGHKYTDILCNEITIHKMVMLFSCNGGTPGASGISAAMMISNRTRNAPVLAASHALILYLFGYIPTLSPNHTKYRASDIIRCLFKAKWVLQRYNDR